VNLNPAVNVWFLLSSASGETWHLENPRPRETQILLDEKYPAGIIIAEGRNRHHCPLFESELKAGRSAPLIYYPLCEGRVYLRNPAKGQRTALEAATEFLRDQVWGGEKVIVLFHHLLADRYRDTGEAGGGRGNAGATNGPPAASIDPQYSARSIVPDNLGIETSQHSFSPGVWYPVTGNPSMFVSVIQPGLIAHEILQGFKARVSNLDSVESTSICYLIAFDMDRYELGYALGTQFPGVGWSGHMVPRMRDPKLPGPDGIGSIAPLVSTGLIAPDNGRRTVAAFTAGFKRTHGAFHSGELSLKNRGSHYGFIENGVVFSKLQPGVATVVVFNDGSLDMKTWAEGDDRLLSRVRHARQNGVPLVESEGTPGRFVANWGAGNWSGSEDAKLRTIRAGAAIANVHGKRFLIYAVFSDATPSAMARVFQAYQCGYAMLMDMNALEHTYLAVYRRAGSEMAVDHLMKGMSVLDQSSGGQVVPRFLGYPDNRDFFYVMTRNEVKK